MRCERCQAETPADEIRELHGRDLCEDCYMDALSPTRTCDPWAVHSAKNAEQLAGGEAPLTERQEKLLGLLSAEGPLEPGEIRKRLSMSKDELEKDMASLRHLEKLRAAMDGNRKVLRLW